MVRDRKRLALVFIVGLATLIVVWRCFFIVDETEWAVVLRFGKLVKVVEDAGLHFRLPIDSVRKFDKRLQVYNPPATEFLTGDKKNLVLDVYVVWRIADPVRFWQSVGDPIGAEARIHDLVWSELAAGLGNYDLSQLVAVRPEREETSEATKVSELTETVKRRCQQIASRLYGVELVDVGVKRLNFPEQSKEAVFARMRAERERIAKRYIAEGEEIAAKIKA
ncbi:protease modulator HflC [Fervidibacter sp.]|jgi:membrane protease subunit HflC